MRFNILDVCGNNKELLITADLSDKIMFSSNDNIPYIFYMSKDEVLQLINTLQRLTEDYGTEPKESKIWI